ncbi:hypothetical protein [Butyricicoccus pullicaecorum]|uniref:Uncharacterized protein n=2 Tax=Butyricicoccus pullicaecorum TaxID=501571 RepID=R8VTF7_9FIRM|nr:hypothetical protein [Butyricicoccus pullicaecorum]EOQ35818.1 hypothetical protein HMPREF1526_02617 [Butyricicoccus pullicaecorum 1.2]OUP51381.1 hypothetical protein B5F17_13175 [Butyricicoccus pullicaecorum]OUP55348.1 hypothetical protein B5F15_14905 [Butyricicoccus pullicaecorum]SKA67981.1 hypothetical protein SAMN02745978_03058 [Butyricicoccus pullicaecorum DSM 23266]
MKWKYSISILTMTAILAGMGTASAVNMMWSVDIVEQVLQARKDFFMNGLSYRWVDSPEQVNWDEIGDNEVILVPNTEAPDGNYTVDVSQNLSAVNPLDTGKEILYYLFWTEEDKLEADVAALQNKLDLTDEQMEALKELGLKEHLVCQNLSEVYADDASSFNAALDENTQASKQRIQEILGDRTEDFRNWIAAWWEEERQDRMHSDA